MTDRERVLEKKVVHEKVKGNKNMSEENKENWIKEMIERGKPEIVKLLDNYKKYGKNKKIFEGVDTEAITHLLYLNIVGYLGKKEEKGDYLYIFKCNEFYKIGITANSVKKRLGNIQTGSPYEVEFIFSKRKENTLLVESKIHKEYKHKMVRGEWFKLSEDDLKNIINSL